MPISAETIYDGYLNVITREEKGDDKTEGGVYNAYEATSYFFLERLFSVFPFDKNDHMVDFGCGKGRVLFMASQFSCRHVTGYENNDKRFGILQKNVKQYQEKHGTGTFFDIFKENAQSAVIDDTANKFFFFEPFHLKIYAQVMQNIIKSLKRNKRDVTILLYLPQESTLKYLDTVNGFKKEIHVNSILYFSNDPIVTMPLFALYGNYSMMNSIDPNFLMY